MARRLVDWSWQARRRRTPITPSSGHKFYGDINSLETPLEVSPRALLACVADPLPLSGGAASHASGPGRDFGWAHDPEKACPRTWVLRGDGFSDQSCSYDDSCKGNTREWPMLS